ncbi:Anthranilate phosphoribosyltransferase [Patulibacter medicamentivorans]|uniref:Anthranilate phosphoribosyltransferase n=1 Tax=Patulibacter medicamentivorans TaxID=1097667 RepID=H0EAH9_9ACTN|nr:anthranilate phosphoribosyltransferase [Patulibacter medicamentivorans]EHN09306.1 Anthranilate phosphoribosyltransferase [Patulibacter medicamentivorans]
MSSRGDLREVLGRLARQEQLTAGEAGAAVRVIMSGRAAPEQTAGFLMALRGRGETVDEVVGVARAMRELATPVHLDDPDGLVDTAGTGGGRSTFNVSTLAALIAAGAGCRVAKHGNRSSTSRSGSADVLRALGVEVGLSPDGVAASIDATGFGFMFAPAHHPAMRHVVPVRRALGVQTIFNLVGPLTNPAGVRRQVIGVSDAGCVDLVARAVARLGALHALVVRGEDGADELSLEGASRAIEIVDGAIVRDGTLVPEDFGLTRRPIDDVAGGEPGENADVLRRVLAGAPGNARDVAVLNAAATIHVSGRSSSLTEAGAMARESLDSGAAAAVLERVVARTRAGVAA